MSEPIESLIFIPILFFTIIILWVMGIVVASKILKYFKIDFF